LLADAFDTEQLLECMGQLKCAQPVNVPIYVLKKHKRCSESFKKVVIFLLLSRQVSSLEHKNDVRGESLDLIKYINNDIDGQRCYLR
jgi:uridine kinase